MASTVADLDADIAAALVSAFPLAVRMANDFRTDCEAVTAVAGGFSYQMRCQRVRYEQKASELAYERAAVEIDVHLRDGGHLTIGEPMFVAVLLPSFFETLASVYSVDRTTPPAVTEGPTIDVGIISYTIECELWLAP